MRIFLALAIVFFCSTLSSWAAVEPQLEGNWQSGDGTVLSIKSDGSYQKSSQGRVVETGTLTALDSKWSLRTDAGRPDGGTFSLLKGELTLRSSVTATTTWKRASTAPLPATPAVKTTAPLQSGIQLDAQSSPAPPRKSDPFAVNTPKIETAYNTAVRAGKATEAARGFRHGFKHGIRGLSDAAQQAAQDQGFNAVPRGNAGFAQGQNSFSPPPSGAVGRGTYSQMRKAFEQEQLNSLPPPKPIANDRQGDETALYGVKTFENKALGPTKAVRIKVF